MIEHKGEEYYFGAHHIAGICEDSTTGEMLRNLGIPIERDLKKVTHIRILSGHQTFNVPLDLDGLEEYIKTNYPYETKTEVFFDLMRQYQKYFKEDDEEGLLRMFVENSRITYLQLLRLYFQEDEIIKILTALGPGYGGVGVQGAAFNNLSLLISYSLGSGCFKKSNTEVIHDLISGAEEKGHILLEEGSSRLPVCMVYTYREGKKVKVMFTFLVRPDNRAHIGEEYLLERIRKEFPEIVGRWEECFILYDDAYKGATATEWGSVFGWERTQYNYMNTNVYTPCVPGFKGVYAAGNWTTDYGVYGALRTARKV